MRVVEAGEGWEWEMPSHENGCAIVSQYRWRFHDQSLEAMEPLSKIRPHNRITVEAVKRIGRGGGGQLRRPGFGGDGGAPIL